MRVERAIVDFKRLPNPTHRLFERRAPGSRHGRGESAPRRRNQAHRQVRWPTVGRSGDLLGHGIASQGPGFGPRMAPPAGAGITQNPSVVGLDLVVGARAGKHHLRPAAEPREVVVANRPQRDEKVRVHHAARQMQHPTVGQLTGRDQTVGIPAVVLHHRDTGRQRTEQVGDLVIRSGRVGSAGHQNRDAIGRQRLQPLQHGRQTSRQIDPPRGIGDHHGRRAATTHQVRQGRSVERTVQGRRDRAPEIRHRSAASGAQGTHSQTTQVHGDPVASEGQPTNHGPALRTVS
jgi:hypothetical protein